MQDRQKLVDAVNALREIAADYRRNEPDNPRLDAFMAATATFAELVLERIAPDV